jgi:hypothetical protein
VVKNGVEALGKIWHREHFVCQHCDDPLNPEGKICQAEGCARTIHVHSA